MKLQFTAAVRAVFEVLSCPTQMTRADARMQLCDADIARICAAIGVRPSTDTVGAGHHLGIPPKLPFRIPEHKESCLSCLRLAPNTA